MEGESQSVYPGFHRKEKHDRQGKQLRLAGLRNSGGLWSLGAGCLVPGPAWVQGTRNIGLVFGNQRRLVVGSALDNLLIKEEPFAISKALLACVGIVFPPVREDINARA